MVYGHRQVRSQVIGYIIADKYIQEKRIYTLNDIRYATGIQCVVNIPASISARDDRLEIVRGNPTESYNLLLRYSHVLTKAKEDTITHLEQDGNDNFLYYFVALGSSIKDFRQYIRPMISIVDTHLKGLYYESMFVETCLNGNNQLYLLAIRVMDSENNDAWE